eukprot:TRINITY_DN31712_c0_g1_i1.p1 TRINITY_DN31712_c0_g1~~TRINITY_DN31712_c0_g1_i1.p1  ORF type:complete len:157 (+),score=43.41 TRINITY_DN31712_c0_g1_i1:85-555(+)
MSMQLEVEDLPRSIVKRIVKGKLCEMTKENSSIKDISIHKDALSAFAESARIFIHYLSATANDICNDSKRQVINADDVLKAVEEMEFPELLESLHTSLDAFRKLNASKKAENKSKSANRKRKAKSDLEASNGNGKAEDANEAEDKSDVEIHEVEDS